MAQQSFAAIKKQNHLEGAVNTLKSEKSSLQKKSPKTAPRQNILIAINTSYLSHALVHMRKAEAEQGD